VLTSYFKYFPDHLIFKPNLQSERPKQTAGKFNFLLFIWIIIRFQK